ncbi:MAG: hypothetical protein GX751_08950, partial [Desulfuromonadaceae bacterium]|nr:hypothetical protein [Desulfuromonadaceae bacterium]
RQHNQELADLLNRFHALGGFSREQLITAYDSALLRFEAGQDISSGLESSFIYALLGSPQKGARQIKAFMDQFENADFSGGREGYRGIGALVNLLLNLQRENERLCVGIREEKEHAEKLAHQLKELKNIEKIIYERENHQFRIN